MPEDRIIHDCEIDDCLKSAISFPDGHKFCLDHVDIYNRIASQAWCERHGLNTPAEQKEWFYKNLKKAFKRL